ncbi:alpha/beta hydrolase [Corynebacterium sp. A21]|uniref:alpha/beta hydrolase n=1 Tax=Corynebacterium sp. A21 TaxID=3457318 RepID=UPI003FD4565A
MSPNTAFFTRALPTRFATYLRGFHPAGLSLALLFFTWSLTPSLLPRMWYFQALATGISLATGYGIGILGLKLWRWAGVDWQPSAQLKRIGWWVLAAIALVVIPFFGVLGAQWQHGIRELIGVEQDSRSFYVLVLILALLIAVLLIQAGRGIGGFSDRLSRWGRRVLPAPVARIGGIILVFILAWALIEGALLRGVLAAAEWSAAPLDQTTREGIERPLEPERSGSPDSAEEWKTLGRDGRAFVASGPRAAEITEVTGREAREPIRVYAGVASAASVPEIAERAVAELHRTEAFERSTLLVVTTTGRGWVNTAGAESLEYLTGGDSAIIGMQYSYLQSPMAFLADRNTPLEAGRVLLEKVYAEWSEMPEDDRPKLLVMGESLGSYGAQGAVGSESAMIASLDGGLLIGTPNFAQPWAQITEDRDPGSLERLPIIDQGRHIRFAGRGEDLSLPTGGWETPRFVFWQHAGDPITWWSFELLLNKPDWLAEERGPDVHPDMRWLPFVTFWQVTADMALSVGVPAGFGHHYGEEAVDLWVGILEPEGWEEQDTERIREVLREPDSSLAPLGEFY